MERNLPGVFSAAGLMVPDPSMIPPPPIPFIDDVAGIGGAEYMVSLQRGEVDGANASIVAPTVLVRESARSRVAVDGDNGYSRVMTECVLTRGPGASLSHAGRARKESLGPLFPGTILPLSQRVEADG